MSTVFERILSTVLGGQNLGRFEFYLRPSLKTGFGGPLNGSVFRQEFFRELISSGQIKTVIETGTFRAMSTEFFAKSGCGVWTVEAIPRFFGFAKERLRKFKNAHATLGDSRSFLRDLSKNVDVPKSNCFFYLDAHWQEDLPLRDELEIIFEHWEDAIVMVDDFKVPNDLGYTYDDYGPDKCLCMEYLIPLKRFNLVAFFPNAPSKDESGLKRGWVVLARNMRVVDSLRQSSVIHDYSN